MVERFASLSLKCGLEGQKDHLKTVWEDQRSLVKIVLTLLF